jgi:hypothetical protein
MVSWQLHVSALHGGHHQDVHVRVEYVTKYNMQTSYTLMSRSGTRYGVRIS